MGKPQPIAVGERTAAGMLDMRPTRFRELVNKGKEGEAHVDA